MPHVMVISSEGYFYSYNIDLENGGECSLMKQYRQEILSDSRRVRLLMLVQSTRFRGRLGDHDFG